MEHARRAAEARGVRRCGGTVWSGSCTHGMHVTYGTYGTRARACVCVVWAACALSQPARMAHHAHLITLPGRECCSRMHASPAYHAGDACAGIFGKEFAFSLNAWRDLLHAPLGDLLAGQTVAVKDSKQRLVVRAIEWPADAATILVDLGLANSAAMRHGADAVTGECAYLTAVECQLGEVIAPVELRRLDRDRLAPIDKLIESFFR